MKNISALIAVVLLLAAVASAQTPSGADKLKRLASQKPVAEDMSAATSIVVLDELGGAGKVIKGAPYTGTAITETTQTLGDGNRIVNTTTAFLARDSEGRTRREESCPKVGNLQTKAPKMLIISDPVTHSQYISMGGDDADGMTINNPAMDNTMSNVVVHKMDGSGGMENLHVMAGMGGGMVMHKSGMMGSSSEEGSSESAQHESLGTQVIEGVTAEGVRDTRTIPAGAIGNEKPIAITSETWTSPDLQMVVLSKRNDPRFGETVYKLTEITRGEPDPALFQIPSGAKKNPAK